MDILSLRLFLRVSERGALTAAAKDLSLSPASASARIAKLEETLGFQLFNRTTRAVSLTTDGSAFLSYAEHMLETLDAGLNAVSGNDKEAKGLLRMAMTGSFGRMHIIPLLGEFQLTYPNVSLDLSLSDEFINMVEGGYDLTIRNAPLVDSNFVAKKLAPDHRLLVASPIYLQEHGKPSTISDLKKHQYVTLTGSNLIKFQNGQSFSIPHACSVNDGEAMRALIEQGLGIGIKSLWNASESLKSGRLVQVLPEYPLITESSIWALYPKGRIVIPKVRVMVEFLLKQFSPVPPWV
ncbi:MAG TPA: LysR substrate-binding domain-containing protein [Methylophilaceae bacterium]|nr:LysR substrate-binding domain-containing protein [Methylophilaceae bacterium]HQC28742.1 LysR substrate-binding domain-containing protein [Methylotenera sp.]